MRNDHGWPGDVRVESVLDSTIMNPTDAILRVTVGSPKCSRTVRPHRNTIV